MARIRQRAADLGFGTVVEMAERFGVARQHMYKLLDGTHLPTMLTAQRMAKALGMAVEDLYDEA